MPEPFYFGDPQRLLFGLRHPAEPLPSSAMLVCGPLLQEGIRCQRALWSLGQALAAQGTETMRFDWHGSGDSAGGSLDISLPGLVSDLTTANEHMRRTQGQVRRRVLGLRSAAVPVLLQASSCAIPVDLVLWAPVFDGRALVASWRQQHARQLHGAGRFLKTPLPADDNELLGFEVQAAFLEALQEFQCDQALLPAGSRILLVQWRTSDSTDEFLRRQRAAGVAVECLPLELEDEPDWDNPDHFETQIFPRRAVARVAAHLAEAA